MPVCRLTAPRSHHQKTTAASRGQMLTRDSGSAARVSTATGGGGDGSAGELRAEVLRCKLWKAALHKYGKLNGMCGISR